MWCGLVFLIALLLSMGLVDMAGIPSFWFCTGRSNYTVDSAFAHNRQQALASVVANVSLTGFHIAFVGKTPDLAFAGAQCRGDLDGEACQVCASDAASQVTQQCPRNGLVVIIFPACVLVCSDTHPTLPPTVISLSLPGLLPIPNPERFKHILTFFFNKLIVSATTNPSGRLFWGDKFKYTHNLTIYGTAQCVQYATPYGCRSCLGKALAQMLRDAAGRMAGLFSHDVECILRFDPFPIFIPPPRMIAPSSIVSVSSKCSKPTLSNKAGSPFHGNLKALLPSLILHAPASGFYSDTIGVGSSQVHGQALCRGDVPGDVCWECIGEASTRIQELCPNSRRAIIWLERCQLRYADENFAGMVDAYDSVCQPSVENTSNPASFSRNLKILIANLTLVAMSFSNRFFATGVSSFAESKRIYALVQCVTDIPADQCGWCLRNASSDIERCFNGKQSGRILRGSCSLAFGVKPFFSGDPTPVSLPQPNHGHKRWWIFVVAGCIAGLLLTATCAFCLLWRRRKHVEKLKEKEATSIHPESVKENQENYDLPQISLKTVEDATDKFSEPNKLGEGGFGPVYKGKLPSGQDVAVKRLSGRSNQGLKEFRNEVESMAKLQHTNLVRLIGCCLEKGEKMLIYEYMPNKSLDFFLKDQESRLLLGWEKRFNIIRGVARGMLYLHRDSRLNVIHRDLKASNVLLDEQLNPKISDFGLARIFSEVQGQGQAITSVIVGTHGYMAPEYAMDGVFSTKSDVYSFGILVLEIISGQLNSASICINYDGLSLIEHGWRLWCEEKKTEFIDPILEEATSASDQVVRCLHIGFLCIQEDAAIRPTMSTVVSMLGNGSFDLPLPTHPAFIGESGGRSSLRRSSIISNIASGSTTT